MSKKIRARKKPIDKRSKWKDEFIYQCYQYSREGLSDTGIQQAIGINGHTMRVWRRKYPAFRKAIEDGRDPDAAMNLATYIYKHLDPHLQKIWDELQECDKVDDLRSRVQINALLHRMGRKARQSLFVYAWTHCNFAISKALTKVNITKPTFDLWCKERGFRELVAQITWHKKNFFEEALIKACSRGETAAIIFANKTFNRDLGYNERIDLNINNQTKVIITPVSELGLTLDERKRMLAKMRSNQLELKDAEAEIIDE